MLLINQKITISKSFKKVRTAVFFLVCDLLVLTTPLIIFPGSVPIYIVKPNIGDSKKRLVNGYIGLDINQQLTEDD